MYGKRRGERGEGARILENSPNNISVTSKFQHTRYNGWNIETLDRVTSAAVYYSSITSYLFPCDLYACIAKGIVVVTWY